MDTTLASLMGAALRIAGITMKPGITPSSDQFGELIPATNRMLSSYSLDGHRIYTSDIRQFALTSGKKVYTIGPGGEMDCPRPIYIKEANILFPTSPTVRRPVAILSDDEWASITVQDIPGAPSLALYYDGGMDANGRGNLYLYYQPPSGYTLELYTWLQLKSDFTAASDVVVLPPGYEEMIVWNLGIRAAAMYPRDAMLGPDARDMAMKSLRAVQASNAEAPKQVSEAGFGAGDYGEAYPWTQGPFLGH